MDETKYDKHMENAREDLAMLYCGNCQEFKYECPDCGGTYCIFCDFDCGCED